MHTVKSAPQPIQIAESPRHQPPSCAHAHEVASIYPSATDRFVVSIIFGYSKNDGGIETPKQAAKAALEYVRKEDDGGTVWHVYDRETKELIALEESEFVNEPEVRIVKDAGERTLTSEQIERINRAAIEETVNDAKNDQRTLFAIVERYIMAMSLANRLERISSDSECQAEVLGFDPATGKETP